VRCHLSVITPDEKIARPRYLTAHPILVDVVRRRSMLFAMI
jgi:hypothetical protein